MRALRSRLRYTWRSIMGGYAHITRCAELSEDDIVSALEDRRSAKMLLDRLARVAQPNEGAPKVLHFLGRMAKGEVDWIDGTLHVEVIAEGDTVRVDVLSDVGIGMQERLFPSLKMAAPFEEFTRMVDLMPRMFEPLAVVTEEAKRLVLEAGVDARWPTSIPKSVAIAEDSLYRRKGSRPKMEAPESPPRSTSSAKMRAARRDSRPDGSSALRAVIPRSDVEGPNSGPPSGTRNAAAVEGSVESQRGPQSVPEIVIPTISARSGRTIRPVPVAVRPSSHKHTLRPDSHAVPPPIPAVPPATDPAGGLGGAGCSELRAREDAHAQADSRETAGAGSAAECTEGLEAQGGPARERRPACTTNTLEVLGEDGCRAPGFDLRRSRLGDPLDGDAAPECAAAEPEPEKDADSYPGRSRDPPTDPRPAAVSAHPGGRQATQPQEIRRNEATPNQVECEGFPCPGCGQERTGSLSDSAKRFTRGRGGRRRPEVTRRLRWQASTREATAADLRGESWEAGVCP